jgi:MFS family permease
VELKIWHSKLTIIEGNARVFGFEEGTGLQDNQFNDVSTVFYATYIAFEIPWTVALKHYGSNYILAALLVGWSVVTLCTGFVHTYGQAITMRVLLGVFESGLSPCLAVTMSTIWDRQTIGWRISLLYVANALSGAFGGLIAYAIQSMGTQRGLAAWRWLFIVEGAVSLVVGGIALFTLPKNAEEAWFLKPDEKELMRSRKKLYALYKGSDDFDMKYVKMAFTDPLIFLGVLCSLGASVGLFGYTTFLPTIL